MYIQQWKDSLDPHVFQQNNKLIENTKAVDKILRNSSF